MDFFTIEEDDDGPGAADNHQLPPLLVMARRHGTRALLRVLRGFLLIAGVTFILMPIIAEHLHLRTPAAVAPVQLPAITEENFVSQVSKSEQLPVLILLHYGHPHESLMAAGGAFASRGKLKVVTLDLEKNSTVADQIDASHIFLPTDDDGWVFWNGVCFSHVFLHKAVWDQVATEGHLRWSLEQLPRACR